MSQSPVGTIYLLCFDKPHSSGARHYLGWTQNLVARLTAHRTGRGAKLTASLAKQGVGFTIVAVLMGTRDDERRLKSRHQLARLCPVCRPAALAKHAAGERVRRAKRRRTKEVAV